MSSDAHIFNPHVFNGAAEAYPTMLKSIRQAKRNILFVNYCNEQGSIFNDFHEALLAARKRGVTIYVLMDAYGSRKTDPAQIEAWDVAGIRYAWFRPFRWSRPLQYNKRLHKKLLIVDDEIGFTGGVGIGDFWIGLDPEYPIAWRDTHFAFQGPVVLPMIAAFRQSWRDASKIALEEYTGSSYKAAVENPPFATINSVPGHYPALAPAGLELIKFINRAHHTINITTAYFGPSRPIVQALKNAASRGVHIRIITNGAYATDHRALEAGRWRYQTLLNKGIHIYEYQPTKIHTKLVVVDEELCQLGSANLNFRSFYHDQEFNIQTEDSALAVTLTKQFEDDVKQCQQISAQGWRARPLSDKIRQASWSLARTLF